MPFTTKRRVEFADTDMANIVHFSNFFRFMEAAEQEFLRSLGFRVVRLEERLGFPRVSASCDYLRPARFEDVIDVTVAVQNIGRKSVTYRFDFALGGEGLRRADRAARVAVVEHKLESVEIPPGIARKMEASLPAGERPGEGRLTCARLLACPSLDPLPAGK